MTTTHRGFAAMDQNKARAIQSQGGKTVSQDRQHMANIGRRGGEHSRRSHHQEQNKNVNFSDSSNDNP